MDENDDAQMTLLTRALERTSCTMWEFAQHARRFTEIVAVINAGWSRSVDLNDVSLDPMDVASRRMRASRGTACGVAGLRRRHGEAAGVVRHGDASTR
jgi:hypothetical protein